VEVCNRVAQNVRLSKLAFNGTISEVFTGLDHSNLTKQFNCFPWSCRFLQHPIPFIIKRFNCSFNATRHHYFDNTTNNKMRLTEMSHCVYI